MSPRVSDHLHRAELAILTAGASTATVLLALNANDKLRTLLEGPMAAAHVGIYAAKLVLIEAALLAPFLVLALLGRALLRETGRCRYRCAGLALSLCAAAGVVGMLISGFITVDLEETMDTLVGNAVPALVLLTTCAGLYGGLIRVAQHDRLDAFTSTPGPPANRPPRP